MDGHPCVRWGAALRPLQVGDSARIETGRFRGSDCVGPRVDRFAWSSPDSSVATVRPNGWVIGRAPGTFRAVAQEDSVILAEEGFVLPAGWRIRITPEAAAVRVGDTVRYEVRALSASGELLPPVPYSLLTAEFGEFPDSGPRREPPVDKWSHQNVTGPAPFVGQRVGSTMLRGEIGPRSVTARLTVVPADSVLASH